ncbi:hypothetical protein MCP_0923 [Methanocella paludicola SANAE]|uniref:Uncharacterized protein n=1 Tax=Methanocella paludicola (strain DSM 17711 / JCM 13418 / NBRC 101707 / SANAE) TaxID=304371 RepID=D1YX23_METPS|nr:hypothetical protein [Methanocella paludicola]BAI60995.1 hypothetical protein MCP_0923 [Methanocella paludicola SANAE]
MRISSLWAALALACIIIVAAAGASYAQAGFTGMFTLALPEHGHAQASPLKSGDFVWRALDIASQSGVAADPGLNEALAIKKNFSLGSQSAPALSTNPDWMSAPLLPGIAPSNNLAMSSYDGFLKRYMNGTGNIFTS